MNRNGHSWRLLSLLLPAVFPILSTAATFSFAGNFGADNQEQYFLFTTTATNIVSAETFSYGGGTQPGGKDLSGNAVPAGGFSPALSLFNGMGALIAQDITGGTAPGACNGRAIDPTTHFCLDAYIFDTASVPLTLPAGMYTLVLTQQGNVSDGTLSDGFTYDAKNGNDPSYTGTNSGQTGKTFIDQGNNTTQRNAHWDLSITGASLASVTEVPEPSTLAFLLAGCALMAYNFSRLSRSEGKQGR